MKFPRLILCLMVPPLVSPAYATEENAAEPEVDYEFISSIPNGAVFEFPAGFTFETHIGSSASTTVRDRSSGAYCRLSIRSEGPLRLEKELHWEVKSSGFAGYETDREGGYVSTEYLYLEPASHCYVRGEREIHFYCSSRFISPDIFRSRGIKVPMERKGPIQAL